MALKDHQVMASKDEAEKQQEKRGRRSPHQGVDGYAYIDIFFKLGREVALYCHTY